MIVPIKLEDSEYSYSLHMSGSASTLGPEENEDIVARLRAVVAEVTGKPEEKPAPRRIGFV